METTESALAVAAREIDHALEALLPLPDGRERRLVEAMAG